MGMRLPARRRAEKTNYEMAGALIDIAERTLLLRLPLGAALRRAAGLQRSTWGTAFAHFGIGVTLMGIVSVTTWGLA